METPCINAASMTPIAAATTLAGYTVALTDPHQQRLAILLRQRGAATVDVPLLHVVPGHRDARLRTATRRCVHAPVDYAVAATATGWLRWFDAAAAWNLSEALLAALGGAAILSTSSSVRAAVLETGLTDVWSSPSGDLAEAVAWLLDQDLAKRRVAVTADEAPPAQLIGRLRARDAEVLIVPTRRWVLPPGLAPVHRLAQMVIQREVHAVAFATASVATALVDVAIRRGHRNGLLRALATDVVVASADAESAGPFLEWDIPVCWTPDDGPNALARLLTEALVARRREFRAADARFAVQGDAVLVDGATIRLAPGPAAVMRVLTDHPGHTLSRAIIEQRALLPRHAGPLEIERAVRRLRAALGEYGRLVVTVRGRGYRLVVD
jgi:uroporphyrinogen-III synthase